jgi:hypothetical protein
MRCRTIGLSKISHAVGFVPCEVKVITSGGDCESLDLILFQLLYPRERKNQSNFTTETTMLLRALDKQAIKNTRSAPSTMPRQRQIIFQPISPIEVTAIAFWEVVSQVNAINHVLLIREHG